MLNNHYLRDLKINGFFFSTGHKQGRSDHARTQVRTSKSEEKKLFYLFLYLTLCVYLFIGFLAKSDHYTCKSFLLYCCSYFTKRNLCQYCTIAWIQNPRITTTVTKWKGKNKMDRNPRIASQRLAWPFDPLKSFSSFFWEVHKRIWPDLTRFDGNVKRSHLRSELMSSWGVQGARFSQSVQLSWHLSGRWIKWPRDQWATSLAGVWLTRSIKRKQQKVSIFLKFNQVILKRFF